MEQLQFSGMESTGPQRPATHSEPLTHQADTRTPAQVKRDANRERVAGLSPGTQARYKPLLADPDADSHDTSMERTYGIPVRASAAHLARLSPFDDNTFHRFGEVREMPLIGNGTIDQGGWGVGQSHVNADRVHELAQHPETGRDPRGLPHGDLPLSANVDFQRNGRVISAPVIHNGTHRVAAAVERGEMFTPVLHIPGERMDAAVQDARMRRNVYGAFRQFRNEVAYNRMRFADPTVGGGRRNPPGLDKLGRMPGQGDVR